MAKFEFKNNGTAYEIVVWLVIILILLVGLLFLIALIKGSWWILWHL